MDKNAVIVIEPTNTSIRIIVGYLGKDNLPVILYACNYSNEGTINNGVITNSQPFVELLKKFSLIQDEKANVRFPIKNAVVILPPRNLKISQDKRSTLVSSQTNRVNELDIRNVVSMIVKNDDNDSNVVLDVVPEIFYTDKEKFDRRPLDVESKRIGLQAIVYRSQKSLVDLYLSCFETAGISVSKLVIAPACIASYLNLFSSTPFAYIAVDIGEDISSISLLSKHRVYNSYCFNFAGKNITSIIADKFNIAMEDAAQLKKYYGYQTRQINFDPVIANVKDNNLNTISISLSSFNKVLAEAIDCFFDMFEDFLNKIIFSYNETQRNFPICFLGGSSKLRGLKELFKKRFPNKILFDVPLPCLGARSIEFVNCLGAMVSLTNENVLSNLDKKENTRERTNKDSISQ